MSRRRQSGHDFAECQNHLFLLECTREVIASLYSSRRLDEAITAATTTATITSTSTAPPSKIIKDKGTAISIGFHDDCRRRIADEHDQCNRSLQIGLLRWVPSLR